MKKIKADELEVIINEMSAHAKKRGITREDVEEAIKEVRANKK